MVRACQGRPACRCPSSASRTRDGVVLDGVAAHPRGRRRTALIWVHGLGSTFSSGQPLIRALSAAPQRRGHRLPQAQHARPRRGHARRQAARGRGLRATSARASTTSGPRSRWRCRSGYRRVILAGHSTGANKVLHYMARTRDRRVAGLMLLGPVSDVAGERKRIGRRALARRVVAAAERLARRDPEALIPRAWGFRSAARFVSLYRPGEAEDVFPYYRPDAGLARARTDPGADCGDRRQPGRVSRPAGGVRWSPPSSGTPIRRAGVHRHHRAPRAARVPRARARARARDRRAGRGRWGSGGWMP